MPIIDATPFPDRGHVLVETNWQDVPSVECVQVVRIDAATGEVTPLRVYVYPCAAAGEYLTLSGGVAVFWDTEAPLDRPFYYQAIGLGWTDPDGDLYVTPQLELDSEDGFWLRDPVRPCNDRRVLICWTDDPACVPGQGIFFSELSTETYQDRRTTFDRFNARRPISLNRVRADAEATLTLVPRTFQDRDDLLALNEPGSPLLFSAPPAYGIPDRYISVGAIQVARVSPDHRYTPRMFTMPFITEDRPVGPTQGVCGARFMDLCDTYDTWNDMVTAGLTWADLLLGAAGDDPPTALWREWSDVEALGTWATVESGGTRTWAELKEGA